MPWCGKMPWRRSSPPPTENISSRCEKARSAVTVVVFIDCTWASFLAPRPRCLAVVDREKKNVRFLGGCVGRNHANGHPARRARGGLWTACRGRSGTGSLIQCVPISELDNVIEVEPNHAPGRATTFTVPAALGGVIATTGEVDYFRFSGTKGQVLDLRVFARKLRSPLTPYWRCCVPTAPGLPVTTTAKRPDSYLRLPCRMTVTIW